MQISNDNFSSERYLSTSTPACQGHCSNFMCISVLNVK